MAKHREVTKWVGTVMNDNQIGAYVATVQARFIETKKEFRLVKSKDEEYRIALKSLGFRGTVRKGSRHAEDVLHETEKSALRRLESYYRRQISHADALRRAAKRSLCLVQAEIGDHV